MSEEKCARDSWLLSLILTEGVERDAAAITETEEAKEREIGI
jgi:hypothetical protein